MEQLIKQNKDKAVVLRSTVWNSVRQGYRARIDYSREAAHVAFCTAGESPGVLDVMSNNQLIIKTVIGGYH